MDQAILKKIDIFFKKFKHQVYKKGEILIRADDNPPGIFYLKKGIVKQYAISKKGEELIVNTFKPTSFFPMSWAVNNTNNNYYYEAVSDLEVHRSDVIEARQFIKNNPDVLYDLLCRVYIGVDGLISRMVYLMSENAYDRLVIEILIHARRFGGKHNNNLIEIKITEKDLAAKSGMTRETVSRVVKKLRDKKLISFSKNLLIIDDMKKLEQELS